MAEHLATGSRLFVHLSIGACVVCASHWQHERRTSHLSATELTVPRHWFATERATQLDA